MNKNPTSYKNTGSNVPEGTYEIDLGEKRPHMHGLVVKQTWFGVTELFLHLIPNSKVYPDRMTNWRGAVFIPEPNLEVPEIPHAPFRGTVEDVRFGDQLLVNGIVKRITGWDIEKRTFALTQTEGSPEEIGMDEGFKLINAYQHLIGQRSDLNH